MKYSITVVVIAAYLNLSACSFLAPRSQRINITPSNKNAIIYVDRELVGVGPQSIMLKKTSIHSVTAKCGNSAGTAIVHRKISATGWLDFTGFLFVLPLIGLIAPGSRSLTPSTVSVTIPDESACETTS